MSKEPFVLVEGLAREFKKGSNTITVFKDLCFTIDEKEFVALLGPSGSGKTTILNLLAGFDRATAGRIRMGDVTITDLDERGLAEWRASRLGFVFQSHNLISLLTAVENVEFPLRRMDMSGKERRERALAALKIVGLEARAKHFPNEMSGGEEQRVAIARALVTDPALIMADEPTGNLDAVAAKNVMEILKLLNQEHGKTILLVTHDLTAAKYATRRLVVEKGVLSTGSGEAGAEEKAKAAGE